MSVVGFAAAATPAQSTSEPLAAYAHSGSATTVRARSWNGTAWGSEVPAGALGAGLCQLDLSRGNPTVPDALLTVNESRALRLHLRDAGAWDGGALLCPDVGGIHVSVASVAHEQISRDLLIVYRSGTGPTLRYRTRSGGVLSGESSVAASLPGAAEEVLLAAQPNSDGVSLLCRSGTTLTALIWDGNGFGPASTLTTSASTIGRACDAVYESASGDALVIWSEGASIRSATHSGAWSSPSTVASPGGLVHRVRVVADPEPASDAALLCYETSTGIVAARPWTGSAWGASLTLDTQGAGAVSPAADAAWQPDGARAVVAWTRSGATLVRSRTWDGAGWSAERTGPTLGTAAQRVRLATGSAGPEVLAAWLLRPSSLSIDDYLVYADSSVSIGSTTVHGAYGANASGINLPSSPGSSHGSTNLNYGNNQTVTIAPGNYGDCKFGNHCTINLSAGTYRFKTFDVSGNTVQITCDTTAGDVVFILANGNLDTNNNFVLTNTGGGGCTIHIVNGNFQAKNNTTITGADIRVYNGNIQTENNLIVYGTLWASANVQLGSGDVFAYSGSAGTSGPLVAVPFNDGTAGSLATLSSDARGGVRWESFEVLAPRSRQVRITNWREVAPQP